LATWRAITRVAGSHHKTAPGTPIRGSSEACLGSRSGRWDPSRTLLLDREEQRGEGPLPGATKVPSDGCRQHSGRESHLIAGAKILRASVRRHRRAQRGSPMLRSIRPKRAA
jgi:hypothetical protein